MTLFFAAGFCYLSVQAQTTFQATVGALGIDKTNAIIPTPDKGFILAGETCNDVGGKGNAFVVKLDQNGKIVWANAYGSLQDKESLNDIKITPDNGLVSVGERYLSNPVGRGELGVLLKTDASGNTIWWKEFDHQGNEAEGFSLQIANDNGFVIAGMMKDLDNLSDPFFTLKAELQHLYVLKTDKDGVSLWSGYISGDYSSKGQFIQQTKDGGYIITGSIYKAKESEDTKICLLKLDKTGSMEWFKVYDNNGKKEETGMSVLETADNGFMVCGTTVDAGQGADDIFLFKTNKSGDILWSKTFGGPKIDIAKFMQKLSGGGYVITGTTNSFGMGSNDAFLMKVDDNGQVVWFKTYGSNLFEMASCVAIADDGFAMAGFNINSGVVDGFCVKTDKNGSNICANNVPLKSAPFPLTVAKPVTIKWVYTLSTNMVKSADANAVGAAAPVVTQKSLCQSPNTMSK
jgi:hypothetical protein